MPITAYFGSRKQEFDKASGLETIEIGKLPTKRHFDIIVIDGAPSENTTVPTGTVGIVSSDNKRGLECLMRSGVRTVTCGMSRRDTVTLSSSFTDVTVCLQRRLPSMTGEILEPAEYPVAHSHEDYMLILLCAAARLLSGREPI